MVRVDETIQEKRREDRVTWLRQTAGGFPVWAWFALTALVVFAVLGVGAWWTYGRGGRIPAVGGFYDGKQVQFIHTEASDRNVASRLTAMVSSRVIVVPELAKVPASALGNVYVFTNGVRGNGPMGFQPDVFDSVPGTPSYSPLRALNLVSWQQKSRPRVLTSAAEVLAAARRGEIEITRPGTVVNMPVVQWPGGHR